MSLSSFGWRSSGSLSDVARRVDALETEVGNAESIRTRPIDITAPTGGDLLRYNGNTNTWENKSRDELLTDETAIAIDAPDTTFNGNITGVVSLSLDELVASPAAGLTLTGNMDAGSNFIKSAAIPVSNDDLSNKAYVDSSVAAGVADKVSGVAAAVDERIPVFDGTTGKLVKQTNVVLQGNRFQAFDAQGNPTIIEFNGDVSVLGFDIGNVGAITADTTSTDTIASKTGSTVVFNNKPQSSTFPTLSNDLANKAYVDSSFLYAGLSDSATATLSGIPTSILPATGDGSLTVPANSFQPGDTFHLVMGGDANFTNGNTLTVELIDSGNFPAILVLADITVNLETAAATSWELEADFTIRSTGVSGVILTNFDFTYAKGTPSFDFKGGRKVASGTIDTTITSTLDVCVSFGSAGDDITTKLMYLTKMH